MKAEESKRFVIVSIFITVALVIMALGIFTLGGQQKRFGKSVEVKAIFDNVSGLKQGNNVWFSGVKIGTVKSIVLYNQSQVLVTMNIEEESQKYIRKDALARLGSESMIGNKMVEIVGGTMQVAAVTDNDVLRVETALSTDEILETFQENNKNLQAITTDFKAVSAQIAKGQGPVGKLISDSAMAQQFEAIMGNLERVSATTALASASLNQFTTRLNNKNGLVNTLLTDTTLFDELYTSAQKLQEATGSASKLAKNLEVTSQRFNEENNAIGLLFNDTTFARQMRGTMGNLEKSAETLNEDLEAIKNNFLLKGYFRRKAKREAKQADKERERLEREAQGK